MKTAGWIILAFGILGIFGSIIGGTSAAGPFFWTAIGAFLLHRGYQKEKEKKDKDEWSNELKEEKIENRPFIIRDPSSDLSINQKHAIVNLLAFIQGASPLSAYNEKSTQIFQSIIDSLNLSQQEVEKCIKVSMNHDPDIVTNTMMNSLAEIRDRRYINTLHKQCQQIAEISGDRECMEIVENIFQELNSRIQ